MENHTSKNDQVSLQTAFGHNVQAGGKVKLADAEIYYEIYGSGHPILFLHGNGQSINAFKNQIHEFAKSCKVIAVDTRGHGNSHDMSSGSLSYEMFAEDMRQLLDALKIHKTDILGWSDGAIIGIIMAINYPAYVNKLAVMGANIFPTPGALKDIVFTYTQELIDDVKYRKDTQSVKQKRIYELLLQEPNLTFEELKNIKSPTLVMAGENDLIHEHHTKKIAENIPDSKLKIFKNADHYAPFFAKIQFNAAVMEFLQCLACIVFLLQNDLTDCSLFEAVAI